MLNNPFSPRGFSLTELMIGIVIMSILLTAALPSFTAWIQNAKIRTAAESLQNGLQLARGEAVRRNQHVLFSLVGTDGSWKVLDATGAQIQSRSGAEGGTSGITLTLISTAPPTLATSATFNGLGQIITPNADGSLPLAEIDVAVPTSILPASQMRPLRIKISAGGQIRSCDPYFTNPTDPRAC